MALTLTKKVTCIWSEPPNTDTAYRDAREGYINQCIADGITNGVWEGDTLTSIRYFTDQAAAEKFLDGWLKLHESYNRAPVSTTILDM
jgi:hypothetical protein